MQTVNENLGLPKPEFEVIKQLIENKHENGEERQWLVKCKNQHVARVILPVTDGKVKPPVLGETNYVLVTQRFQKQQHDGAEHSFAQTTVYASDDEGKFFDAVLYATPGIRDIWEVMYAIGEI